MRACLVIGSALNWKDDVEAALDVGEFDGVICVKRIGVLWKGRMDAWVTLHPDRVPKELAERRLKGYPDPDRIFSQETVGRAQHVTDQIDYKLPGQRTSGSSGLFAVRVAQVLGFGRVVLCGIPMSNEYGKVEYGPVWHGEKMFRDAFVNTLPLIKDTVRSMSGWTRELLGAPTSDWLRGA
jgi:hypothetical protein